MMHACMTWSFQLAGITLQMLAIPSVMLFWCHSVGFGITSGSGKVVVCGMVLIMASFQAFIDLLDRPQNY